MTNDTFAGLACRWVGLLATGLTCLLATTQDAHAQWSTGTCTVANWDSMDYQCTPNTTVTPTGNGQKASDGDSTSERPDQAAPAIGYAKYSARETFMFMGYGPLPQPREYTFSITGACIGEANPPSDDSSEIEGDNTGVAISASAVGSFNGSCNNSNAVGNVPSYNVPVSSAGSFTPASNSYSVTYDVTCSVSSDAEPAQVYTPPAMPGGPPPTPTYYGLANYAEGYASIVYGSPT